VSPVAGRGGVGFEECEFLFRKLGVLSFRFCSDLRRFLRGLSGRVVCVGEWRCGDSVNVGDLGAFMARSVGGLS
jgi:hypothetical protein